MKRNNVIYLDDYRNLKMQRSRTLQQVIENHLAEADRFRRTSEEIRQCLDGNIKYWPEQMDEHHNSDPPRNQRG